MYITFIQMMEVLIFVRESLLHEHKHNVFTYAPQFYVHHVPLVAKGIVSSYSYWALAPLGALAPPLSFLIHAVLLNSFFFNSQVRDSFGLELGQGDSAQSMFCKWVKGLSNPSTTLALGAASQVRSQCNGNGDTTARGRHRNMRAMRQR